MPQSNRNSTELTKITIAKYLLFSLLFLAILVYGANIRTFKIKEDDGSCISGIYFPSVCKYIVADIPYFGDVIRIEIRETPSVTLTTLKCGPYSSQVRYDISAKEFNIKEFTSSETGIQKEVSNYCMPRSKAVSDYYSPFFHKEGGGWGSNGGIRLNTEFGLYQIS